MKTIAEKLREFRVNVLAKIIPPGEYAPDHRCGVCGGPASHQPGSRSGKTLVVPAGCGHQAYALDAGPRPPVSLSYDDLMRLRAQSQEHAALIRQTLEPKQGETKLKLAVRSVLAEMKEAA